MLLRIYNWQSTDLMINHDPGRIFYRIVLASGLIVCTSELITSLIFCMLISL